MKIKELSKNVLNTLNGRRFAAALLIAFILASACSLVSFNERYGEIKSGVLRLHISANSDSEDDQALKLLVRDRVLEVSKALFSDCKSVDDAENAAAENFDILLAAANEVLTENGSDDTVTVSLENTWFEDRVYDGFTLPAGEYKALRMVIGEGKGHNWWCVMYPGVCIPAATDTGKMLADTLGSTDADMLENPTKYVAKFKIVELYEKIKYSLKERNN